MSVTFFWRGMVLVASCALSIGVGVTGLFMANPSRSFAAMSLSVLRCWGAMFSTSVLWKLSDCLSLSLLARTLAGVMGEACFVKSPFDSPFETPRTWRLLGVPASLLLFEEGAWRSMLLSNFKERDPCPCLSRGF